MMHMYTYSDGPRGGRSDLRISESVSVHLLGSSYSTKTSKCRLRLLDIEMNPR